MDCPICTHPERGFLEAIDADSLRLNASLLTTMPWRPELARAMAEEHWEFRNKETWLPDDIRASLGGGLRHTAVPSGW